MPKYKFGDMWKQWGKKDTLFCITTNSYIKKNGELAMGRGIALELKKRYPNAPKLIGKFIKDKLYGFFVVKIEKQLVGIFQVKYHFKDDADCNIIQMSCGDLEEYLLRSTWIKKVNLNFPGIGYGNLKVKEVKSILDRYLRSKINIWRLKENGK